MMSTGPRRGPARGARGWQLRTVGRQIAPQCNGALHSMMIGRLIARQCNGELHSMTIGRQIAPQCNGALHSMTIG